MLSKSLSLPDDIIEYIIVYAARDIPASVSHRVHEIKRAMHHDRAKRVQHWFRAHRLWADAPPCRLTKRMLIRYYAVHYPDEFLLRYPEFLIRKCNLDRALLRRLPPPPRMADSTSSQLLSWVNSFRSVASFSLMDRWFTRRRRSDVLEFLRQPGVLVDHLEYAGW